MKGAMSGRFHMEAPDRALKGETVWLSVQKTCRSRCLTACIILFRKNARNASGFMMSRNVFRFALLIAAFQMKIIKKRRKS